MTPASPLITNRNYLPSLEGWRGVVALFVAFYHFYGFFSEKQFAAYGYLGVDFFFILSGFIISRQYEAAIAIRTISFRKFAVRRLARLYPLYILSIGLFLEMNAVLLRDLRVNAVDFGMGPAYAWRVLLQLTMLSNIGGMAEPWNGPAWSVSVEWIVNLLFFAMVWHFRRIPSAVYWTAVALCVVYLLNVSPHTLNLYISDIPLFNPTIARGIVGFALGSLIFRYHHRAPDFSAGFVHILETLLMVTCALLLYYHSFPFVISVDYVFVLVLFPALIMISLYREGWLCRFFSRKGATFLGRISYSLYLLHLPLGYIVQYSSYFSGLERPIIGLVFLALIITVSTLSYYLIEQPCRHIGRMLAA